VANVGVTFDFAAESAKLRAEVDKVRREMSSIRASTQALEKGFKTLGGFITGAFSVGAITAFLSRVNQAADQLNDLSQRLGASAANLQVLQLAAQQAGGSAEAMNTALAKMSVTLGDAMAGSKSANEAFSRLGLSARELSGLKTDEAMRRIAVALSDVSNTYDRASIAQAIFGKGSKELAQFFRDAPEQIKQTEEALAAAGAALSDIDIARIGVVNDQLALQSTIVQNLGVQFLSGLTPGIMAAVDAFANLTTNLGGATTAGQVFGTVVTAAVKAVEFAIVSVSGSLSYIQSIWATVYARITNDYAQLLRLFEQGAGALGAGGIAASIGSAAQSAERMSANYQAMAESARAAFLDAAEAANAAAAGVLNPGLLYAQYSAMLDKATEDALRRLQEIQGTSTGSGGDGKGKAGFIRGGQPIGSVDPDAMARDFDRFDPLRDPKVRQQYEINAALAAIDDEYRQTTLGKIDAFNQTALGMMLSYGQMQIDWEQNKGEIIGGLASGLVNTAMQAGGRLGKFGKALAIAQTIWNTGQAVMTAMAQVPWPANIAAAALAAATGVAQLANIKKTNVGSGGSISGVRGGGVTPAAPALNDNVAGTQQQEARAVSQVVIQGSIFSSQETAEWIIGQIRDAVESRDVVFISSNSRQAMELAGA
jgi:hypothetical protein